MVCTEVHCLLTNDENNVVKTLSEYCCRCCCLVTSVVNVSVFFLYKLYCIVLHEHVPCHVVCTEVHCLLTNDENNVVKTLSEYCCRCCCLVTSVVSVSVPFTELHNCDCSCFGTKIQRLPTNYGNCVVRFLPFYCCTVPNIVCISISISELQEHASSHCSLLWYGKGIVYQQIIKTLVSTH